MSKIRAELGCTMCFFKRMNKKERNCIYKCERAELVIGDLLWLSSSCLICASRVSVSPTIPNLCPVFVCVCCACPRLLVLNGRKLDCEMTSNYAFGTRLGALSLAHGPSFSLSVSPIFVLPGFQFFSTWAKTPQALLRRLVT